MLIEPTWLGHPLYPGGFPLQPSQVHAGDRTIKQIYMSGVDTPLTPDEEESVKSYIIYYMGAPIWEIDDPLDKVEMMKLSVWELIQKCLELGLDPL